MEEALTAQAEKNGAAMLRLIPVLLLSSLLGLSGAAAGFATDAPTVVVFVFVGCLGLFVAALTAGAFHLPGP